MNLPNNGRELSELLGALCDGAELSELLGALCDGAITSEQFAMLEQLLCSKPNARDCYVDYMMLCGELKQIIPSCPEQPVLPPAHKPNKSEAHGQEIKEWAKHTTKEEQWKTNTRKENIRQPSTPPKKSNGKSMPGKKTPGNWRRNRSDNI